MTDMAPLLRHIDHEFANPDLLRVALTHRSAAKGKDALSGGNERLEFLGDRVLGLVIAEMLYTRFGREREGAMAKRFVALVRRETLARIAHSILMAGWNQRVFLSKDYGARCLMKHPNHHRMPRHSCRKPCKGRVSHYLFMKWLAAKALPMRLFLQLS